MRHFMSLVAVSLTLASGGVAQELRAGERVRITLPESLAQQRSLRRQHLVLRGTVTRVAADTLFLRPEGTLGELGVVRASARSIHRSSGLRSRRSSAAIAAVTTSLWGAVTALQNYREPDHTFGLKSRGSAISVGAVVGAVGGAAVGALLPTERWRPIARTQRESKSKAPQKGSVPPR